MIINRYLLLCNSLFIIFLLVIGIKTLYKFKNYHFKIIEWFKVINFYFFSNVSKIKLSLNELKIFDININIWLMASDFL